MDKCVICGGVTRCLAMNKTYDYCPGCEFIRLQNCHLLSENQEYNRYLQHDNTEENAGYVKMFRQFLSQLQPLLPAPGNALDFGCGPGPVLAHMLKKRGWDVSLYDPYFAPEEEFWRHKYSLITATEVVEHIHQPLPVWQRLAGLLQPGGVLAIMTSFHPGPDEFCDWWYRRDPTHVAFYNQKTFDWLGEHLGLTVCTVKDGKSLALLKGEGHENRYTCT